jgi:hypothetical protein
MRQFMVSAALTTVFAALLACAPAQAEILGGAPTQNGSQCFKYATGNARDGRFGTWGACPQTASVAAAPAPRQVRRNHRAASR